MQIKKRMALECIDISDNGPNIQPYTWWVFIHFLKKFANFSLRQLSMLNTSIDFFQYIQLFLALENGLQDSNLNLKTQDYKIKFRDFQRESYIIDAKKQLENYEKQQYKALKDKES